MFFYTETRNNRKVFHIGKVRFVIRLRPSFIRILLYRLLQKLRVSQTVCYTCICGDYDNLESHYYIDFFWDYICFTDNQNLLSKKWVGIWQIKPLMYNRSTASNNNRYHKFFPHKILSQYQASIYLDANVNILTNKLKNIIKLRNSSFLLPKHFRNTCIYQELNSIIEDNKDTFENIEVLRKKYETEQMPCNLGFAENNVIYRIHNDTSFHRIMEQWWQMLLQYSKRDQASLVYILWKNNKDINEYTFDNCRLDNLNFCVTDHRR